MAHRNPQTEMPKQTIEKRIHNFEEVALGFNEELALGEAARCLNCPKPQCKKGCPVEVPIPEFIQLVKEHKFGDAAKKLKEKNALPAVCGRVCPQEEQCQKFCVLGVRGDPVGIGRLERYASDWERLNTKLEAKKIEETGGKIAVVGSGPAGLTVAADLAKLGHKVTIFESLHTAGGVLMYGIPQFRLPKEIVQTEVEYVKSLGVEVRLDSTVGLLATVQELMQGGYDAVFIGSGAGLPNFLSVPGENLKGIYSANEFLIRTNLMKAYKFPEYDTPIRVGKRVGVVGAGNVAMDSARCALRLGAERVYIIYRRSRDEMPARAEEAENAEEEGIEFMLLTNPIRFIGNDRGFLEKVECVKQRLSEPDQSGRRRPEPIEGSNFTLEIDTAVIAIGQSPNPIIQQTTEGLQTTRHGTIVVNEETMQTAIPGVYAGGDVVSGAATVISAMGAGKKAAKAIHEHITEKKAKPT
ncbi:MAG: NADPH-dependent glutamate synthase [Candidatus Bathyarchaeota archaeon]|nr:NADPH-dependent glutamate synthase [Candidatus Bathyarchaeota archaeon]